MSKPNRSVAGNKARVLIADPVGGMANRLRFLDCFAYLARETGARLVVRWGNDGMNCDFERLFETNFPVTEIVNTRKHKEESRILRKKREILDRVRGFKNIQRGDTAAIAGDMTRWKKIVADSSIVMRADHRFIRTPDPYDWLRIREEILRRVDDITDSWGPNVLGVHIRRTDNEWWKKRSPTSGFIEKIDAAIDENESIEIFLASDSDDEVRYLQNRYGRRIKQFIKPLWTGIWRLQPKRH